MRIGILGGVFALTFWQGIEQRESWMGLVYQSLAVLTATGAVVWAG